MRPSFSLGACALLALLSLAGCDDDGAPRAYTRSRVSRRATAEVVPGAGPEQRFGASGAPKAQPAPAAAPAQQLPFEWAVPEGWTQRAPTSMRLINLEAGHPDAECYLTFLASSGGGLEPNVNRWRKQMGLPPLAPGAAEQLPVRQVLGKPGVLVELEGAFSGMGGGEGRPNWTMLGVILASPQGTLFVKMTGPSEVVARERPKFEAFLDSLAIRQGMVDTQPSPGGAPAGGASGPMPEGHPPVGGDPHAGHDHASGAHGSGGGELGYTLPAGWRRAPDPQGSMRMLTITLDAAPEAECYVGALRGPAADVEQTLVSWSKQFGGAAPQAANPGLEILGAPPVRVELEGTYRDLRGGVHEGWRLLGMIVARPEETVFVKLAGPADAIAAERERFWQFCRSLRLP